MDQKAIINYVQKNRIKRGLTQDSLGKKIGTSGAVIAHYENNRRSFSVKRWVDLCKILNIKAKDLIELDYKMVQKKIDEK